MAVGKDTGDYAARLRAAGEQAGGFAFVGSQVSWNAPRPENLTADERAQRRDAQKTIDKGLSDIDAALVSPNLSDAQRAELATQRSLLEGMRMQLATGARGADVGQISAMVANVSASVGATAASVSSGGGRAVQLSALEQRYGLQSMDSARTYEEAQGVLRHNMQRVGVMVDENNARWRAKGFYLGTEEEQDELERAKKAATASGDPDAVLKYVELQRKQDERVRQQTKDPEDIRRLDEQGKVLSKMEQDARKAKGLTQEQRKDATDRIAAISNDETGQNVLSDMAYANVDARANNNRTQIGELKNERALTQIASVWRDDELSKVSKATNEAVVTQAEGNANEAVNERRNRFALSSNAVAAIAARAGVTVAPEQDTPQKDAAVPEQKQREPQQVAEVGESTKAREAAKPLAENKSQASEAKQDQTEKPNTQVAAATPFNGAGRTA